MRSATFLALLFLAGCGSWPDAGGPPTARNAQGWPQLLPLNAVLETGDIPAAEGGDADALARRADALRLRAGILRGNATDMDALRLRLLR